MAWHSVSELKGKRVLILGLGSFVQGSGTAAAKWCLRHGMKVTITDQWPPERVKETVAEVKRAYESYKAAGKIVHEPVFILGGYQEASIREAELIVQNPGVPFTIPELQLAKQLNIPVETDLSLFFHFCPFPIIGITGTRGKTTTTMLTAAMLKAHDKRTVIGGNMKVSPLEALDEVMKMRKPAPIILEMSSWQCEGVGRAGFSPQLAAVTNLSVDHLNRYGTMENYGAAKEEIFLHQKAQDTAVFNAENDWTVRMATRAPGKVVWTAVHKDPGGDAVFVREGQVIGRRSGQETVLAEVKESKLLGQHNVANVVMACALAWLAGVPPVTLRKALKKFKGVEGRLEVVRKRAGITWINDTTATSPEGLRAALQAFPEKQLVLITGGTDKELDTDGIAELLQKRSKHLIFLPGTFTEKVLRQFPADAQYQIATSMEDAVAKADAQAKKRGDVVLLSPGAASFGLFLNEFDRGDKFNAAVKALS